MKRIFLFVILELLGFAIAASAQQISPLIAEGGKGKARGEFTVTNNGVQPMITTVEAQSFMLTAEGKSVFLPLDQNVYVKIDQSSFKVGPRQTHIVSYEVQCLKEQPCLVALLPRMVTGIHTAEGIQIGIVIPHSVYLCTDRAKGCRAKARLAAGIPAGK